MTEDAYTPGQKAFEAYNKDLGGVNHLGKKTPPWCELPEKIQHGWEMAALAVCEPVSLVYDGYTSVFLNDRLMNHVISFNTRENWVVVYDIDSRKRIRLTGEVRAEYDQRKVKRG